MICTRLISVVSVINPLVAFYDIHGGKREVLFFYFVPDTTRATLILKCKFLDQIEEDGPGQGVPETGERV
jgi:hypothetical protein